jgi:hypothetical protein
MIGIRRERENHLKINENINIGGEDADRIILLVQISENSNVGM